MLEEKYTQKWNSQIQDKWENLTSVTTFLSTPRGNIVEYSPDCGLSIKSSISINSYEKYMVSQIQA